ncbi:MAG: M56 family metallopeptidase [Henriciella sp.]|uniref:M56 family metallopeptidase n=1 Tax=Henriciella sp. TaxID=1968823 RepID=UPI003C75296D
MNPFTEMNPIVANSLQTSLAVAVLFALMLLVRKPFARQFGAKAAYALWLVPLARLFMPPLPANWSMFGWLAAPVEAAEPEMAQPAMVFHGVNRTATDMTVTAEAAAPPVPVEFIPVHAAPVPAEPGLLDAALGLLPHLVVPLWIAGIALMLGLAWRRQAVFHQLIRDDSSPASEPVTEMAREIAALLKVRRGFEVRTSLLNGSPLVTGLKRPVILLPEWFEADYSPREQRDALTHELMHVKRGDLFALQAAQIVLALQWFNPLAYFSIRAFRIDQEAACDADVLRAGTSSAFSYGRTLIKAARLAGPADSAFRGANLTLAHPIKERLILMQNTAPTLRKRLLGTTLAVTLGTAAVFTTASCAASATPRDQSATELAGGEETQTRVKDHRVYRFSSHKGDEDFQMVILSDPFEALAPRLAEVEKLDLSDLEGEMEKLSIEISKVGEIVALEALEGMDWSSLAELEGLKELEGLHELDALVELGNLKFDFDISGMEDFDIQTLETEGGIKIIIPGREIMLSGLDEDALDIQIEKIEAMADAHAERAEAMAEAHAERAEAWAEAHADRIEERADRMAIVIEREVESRAERMEELGELMELRIEAAFEDGLENDLEAAGEVIEELADQCEDRDEDLSSPEIVSVRGENGETYRALCVNGGQARLKDGDVKEFVQAHPALTDAEKERFSQHRSFEYEYSWSED